MTDETMSPLRRRMIEDMTIRKFAPKTQHDYVQRVKNFAAFLGRSPDTVSFEDVRRYQLHLAASGVGVPTLNQIVSTLRFFFRVTLKRHEIVEHTHVIPLILKLQLRGNWNKERALLGGRPQLLRPERQRDRKLVLEFRRNGTRREQRANKLRQHGPRYDRRDGVAHQIAEQGHRRG